LEIPLKKVTPSLSRQCFFCRDRKTEGGFSNPADEKGIRSAGETAVIAKYRKGFRYPGVASCLPMGFHCSSV